MADTGPGQLAPLPLAESTAEIVSAYVAHHTVAIGDLPNLITTIEKQLAGLGQASSEKEEDRPKPVVPIRRSVRQDDITCLICGQAKKMLKRHLARRHKLDPDAYRALFGLKDDYPMTAPAYAAMRSDLAKKIGLGRRPEPKAAAKRPRKSPIKKPAAKKTRT